MLEAFKNFIQTELPDLKKGKLLLTVSGGIDSVVLTHLCHSLNYDVSLAHCNFNLRADESDADEAFLLQLAAALDLEIFIEYFDTQNYAETHKLSIQMAARELRYNWFNELAEQLGFDFILTAHHADDNLETFLINLSRGRGLDGLTGIPLQNEKILRPLLTFSRNDLVAYAEENNIEWREDSSNTDKKYLRNKIRHEIIPNLKEINPQFLDNFKKTIAHLNEAQSIIKDRIEAVTEEIVQVEKDALSFDVEQIKSFDCPKAYVFELFKNYGFTEWNDVTDLLDAQSGKQIFSQDWRLLKDRGQLILRPRKSEKDAIIQIEKSKHRIDIPTGTLVIEEVEEIDQAKKNIIYVDKGKLQWPLTIRTRVEGDRFHPFGLGGKKKLSKYFKDEKMSLIDKENTWLLCSNQDIVWVIERRADERFKVTDKTKQILKIELK